MAPALRSGRAAAAEPGVCPPRSTGSGGGGAGGGGGRRRWCWRGTGGRSVAANCLLSAWMLTLLARCASAAEEKTTYDASGSLSLLSDPTATAAPARPSTDLSAVEAVPFSAAHSDGDSVAEGGGLSGRAAFSSVLTVMAGTIKHPVSLDQSRTSPTATRDETHTTWPSHSFSRGSEMSSSLSYAGDRTPPSDSGLMSHQHNTQLRAVPSPVSRPSHVSFMDGNTNVSLFSSSSTSSPSLSSLMSSPAPSTYSMLSSLLSLSAPAEWKNKAASTRGERIVSGPAASTEMGSLSPARPHGWTESLKTARSTAHSVHDPPAAQGLRSTATEPAGVANEIRKHPYYSSANQIYAASETYSDSKAIMTSSSSTSMSYSSLQHGQSPLKASYEPTQPLSPGMNSASANHLTISTSFPSNQEKQAVQKQQGDSQKPTSALLPAQPEGYSVSSHVTQQMLYRAAYAEQNDSAAVDRRTFVHKSLGHAVTSPPSSRALSRAALFTPFLTVSSETAPGKESLSRIAVAEPTPTRPGMVSSEPASNRDGLVTAAGQGSSAVPAININNNQGEEAGAELKSISTLSHQSDSLSPAERGPESASRSVTRAGTMSLTPESGSVHFQDVTNPQQSVTQEKFPSGSPPQHGRWTALKTFNSSSTSVALSSPGMPVGSAEGTAHKTPHVRFSQPARPTYSVSLFHGHGPDHSNTKEGPLDSGEVSVGAQASLSSKITSAERRGQTLQPFPHRFYTTAGLMPSADRTRQSLSPGDVSAFHLKSEGAGRSKSLPESTTGLISKAGAASFTSDSDSVNLLSNDVTKLRPFATQEKSPSGKTQELSRWTTIKILSSNSTLVSPSGPVRSGTETTHKTTRESFSHPNHSTKDVWGRSELNFTDQISDQTRSLQSSPHRFYTTSGLMPSPDKSQQSSSSGEVPAFILKSEGAGHSKPVTPEVQTYAADSKSSAVSTAQPLNAESLHRRNAAETSVSPLFKGNEESTVIRDSTFHMEGEFTAEPPTVMTALPLNKGSPTLFPASPVRIDAALGRLISLAPREEMTVTGPASSSSEIIPTPRADSSPRTIVSSNKSKFHFHRQTAVLSTASSAATTSSDGQNSIEAASAIFSSGTKLMAPYTKWKATEPGPFHNGAFHSENTSSGFDRSDSNSPADGPSYEQPNLEEGQERNVHILNSSDPTVVGSGLNSIYPAVGGYPSPTHVKGASDYKEQSTNLSPAHLRFVSVKQRATAAPSVGGSHTTLPLSHIITLSESASQATLDFVHKIIDAVDTAVALSNGLVHGTDPVYISGLTSQRDPMLSALSSSSSSSPSSSSSLSLSPLPVSLSSSPASIRGLTESQVSSFNVKLTTSMPSAASSLMAPSPISSSTLSSTNKILSAEPSMSLGTASSPPSSSLLYLPHVTDPFVVPTEAAGTDELNAGTSRAIARTFLKEKEASLSPSHSDRITLPAEPTDMTSQVPPLTPPPPDTTTASLKLSTTASATRTQYYPATSTPSLRVTTGTTQSTAMTTQQPTAVTRRTTTTTTTTIRTPTRRTFTPFVLRTSPPRGASTTFISPFTTTTTEAPPQQCNITERMWVKTVVSIYVRRNRLDSIQRQNLRRGLSQGLRKALNDTSAQAQVETVFGSPNMTVAYHVTGGDIVYPPSVVLEGLESYGRDKLIADLRQYLPMVTALPLPAALWRSGPATGFQLKTVLQFVGAGDNPRSCRFSQMMEQRLEKVFAEAQAKVLSRTSRLSVQMLSVTQTAGSPAVSLVYTVSNGTVFLNGTSASNLLGQLSAELVGYFLFYPPLIIAEPLEYHNLNTSIATRDFWVITVIQDVDNASLEGQYQSFASLMEQRLAELFVLAGQQGTRFRRATTVGSYTVQMVSLRRVSGLKNPAEMTYYIQHNGVPLPGTSAAKVLNTVDSQTMALTLGYFVQLQAEPVVKNPPNNLWIIAAVLAPIAVVTLIIIIITAVLCRKNKNDLKADAIGNLNPRAKMTYRRDVGYYHQPVQGFDYAKQHLGQQGGDEETLPVSQDTLVMSLQIRDTPLSLQKALQQDGTANRKSLSADKRKSKLPSEDGSVISNESEKLNSGRGLTALKVTAQQKLTKEETRKRDEDLMFDIIPLCRPQWNKVVKEGEVAGEEAADNPYDSSSGSLQLISIKPVVAQPSYSHPASSDRSHDSAIVNGEVNLALKQKSDIEHYRNKLRLKAKRKGYYDFPSTDGSSSGRALAQRQRHGHERAAGEHGRPLEPDDERGSTYVKSHRRHSQVGQTAYRSRQSLSSPSPGGTEMDLLVMRERPRRGIRNSGYDTEPELIEETNVDRLVGPRGYMYGRGLKGHSETSTLSSQPSIDEVRQQMHLLLEEAFSLASGGQSTSGRQSHHHNHHQPPPDHYNPAPPPLPYVDVVTSAPGTMSCGRGGLQWVPSYGADVYQCSLPKPAFRFTQLPEMAMGSPPPLPPRTGPPPGAALRRSTSDLGPKGRSSETSVTEMRSQHNNNPYGLTTRAALPSITAEQPLSNYSGNPITAVYAIPASRSAYSEYFLSTPPTSYHSPSWMSYPPEPEDVPPQWADSVPLPGYVEAFPHPRYPQGSPTRLPLEYNQALEQPSIAPSTASQQSLPQVAKDMDSMPLSSLSTSALVQAIRQEVAKLAKKQNEMFEF